MSPQIVIDCSNLPDQSASSSTNFDRLIDSLRLLSATSRVHVVLRTKQSGTMPRRYQTLLQSFGCTVTARAGY